MKSIKHTFTNPNVCHEVFIRFIFIILSILLGFTANLQRNRPDNIIWIMIFLIPSLLTLLAAIRPDLSVGVPIRAVTSVHIGCCLTIMAWLGTRIFLVLFRDKDIIDNIRKYNDDYKTSGPISLLKYIETWEFLAVLMVVTWLKFLSSTSSEIIRAKGNANLTIAPPRKMLKMISGVLLFPIGLATLYYVE